MISEQVQYEGDYRCEAHEGYDRGDRCRQVAAQVRREPYTPGRFKVQVCDEHADKTYDFDPEATAELSENIARERETETV